jgi:putative MATE family efflux protein
MTVKDRISYKEIFHISFPIIIGSAVENLMTIVNIAFLGRVGAVALGAVAIGGIFYLALTMIAFGFGIGTQIIIARRFGEKNYKEIGTTLQHAAAFLLPFALILLVFVNYFDSFLFKNFVDSHEVSLGVMSFMKYRIWGIVFAFTNILFRAFYTGIQKTRIISYCSMVIAGFNIFLDYSLIFGNFGFPQMGVAGAGLASVVAEVAGSVFFLIYTITRSDIKEFAITRIHKFSFGLLGRIYKVASPVMLQFFISFGGWFAFFMFVEKMGEIPLAASNIVRTFYMIVLLPVWGYSSATNTLVSYKIGCSAINEIMPFVKKMISLATITVLVLVFATNMFINPFLRIYTNDPLIIETCKPIILVVSISSILVTIAVVLLNAVSGTGKTRFSMMTEITVVIFYVLWTFVLVEFTRASISMVWTAEILYGVIMLIMSGLYLKFGNWRKSIV